MDAVADAIQLRAAETQSLSRFAIKVGKRVVFLDPAQLAAVKAEGNYSALQYTDSCYLLRETISRMADVLKPFGFVQIHRSILINRRFVAAIRPRATGQYELRMKNGQKYTVTRTYKANLHSLANCWIGSEPMTRH